MYINSKERYCEDQAITDSAVTTDVVAHGGAGVAARKPVMIQVTETFAGGTSIKVALQTDSAESFTPDEVLYESEVILTANLEAGYRFQVMSIPDNVLAYTRLVITPAGTHTAGKITAFVGSDVPHKYPH